MAENKQRSLKSTETERKKNDEKINQKVKNILVTERHNTMKTERKGKKKNRMTMTYMGRQHKAMD